MIPDPAMRRKWHQESLPSWELSEPGDTTLLTTKCLFSDNVLDQKYKAMTTRLGTIGTI